MARIEHIKRRLDNWALWRSRQNDSGLGYHSRNILALDVWGRGSYGGSMIPHFDEDAQETDRAVELLKVGKGHLYKTLESYYLKDLGVTETGRRMGRAPATIHAQLEQADRAIAVLLEEFANERERKRVAAATDDAKRSFTT